MRREGSTWEAQGDIGLMGKLRQGSWCFILDLLTLKSLTKVHVSMYYDQWLDLYISKSRRHGEIKWSRSVVSDPQWPHGLQPTRLLHPWDFPGKSTGVGCHCLLYWLLWMPSGYIFMHCFKCLSMIHQSFSHFRKVCVHVYEREREFRIIFNNFVFFSVV